MCARAYVCVLLRRSVLRIPAAEVSFGVDGHQGPAKYASLRSRDCFFKLRPR